MHLHVQVSTLTYAVFRWPTKLEYDATTYVGMLMLSMFALEIHVSLGATPTP